MKKTGTILLLGAILALFGTAAFATDQATISVTATVVGTCKFNGAPASYTMDFLNLDPSVGTNASATVTASYWCTAGVTPITLTLGNGLHWSGTTQQMASGGNVIPYSLAIATPSSAVGLGPASPITAVVTGTVQGANYVNAVAGTYTDTVTLTVTP
jgi:spore coat protein U-like protein